MYVGVEVSPSISLLPGLPDAYSMAWGFDPLPCDLKCFVRLSFPQSRVSLPHIISRPAETDFHVHVDPASGPPTLSGFPGVYDMAFGIDRLPCILLYSYRWAPRIVGLPIYIV